MTKTIAALLLAGFLLLGSIASAVAADYCINVDFQYFLVLSSFHTPPPGKCRAITGFYSPIEHSSATGLLSGTACGTRTTGFIIFDLLGADRGSFGVQHHFTLDLARLGLGTAVVNTTTSPPGINGTVVGSYVNHGAFGERCTSGFLD